MPKSPEPFFNVRHVEEVEGEEEANKYLDLGWNLLKILAAKRGGPDYGFEEIAVYCLGWCSSRDPNYPDKEENSEV